MMSNDSDNAQGEEVLYFRPLHQVDREEIKKLHEEWFPVKYTDEFYDQCVNNITRTGDPLYSCVAVTNNSRNGSILTTQETTTDEENNNSSASIPFNNDPWCQLLTSLNVDESQVNDYASTPMVEIEVLLSNGSTPPSTNVQRSGHVAGCIIGTFFAVARCKTKLASQLIRNKEVHTHMFYIMTLGTSTDFRKCGLGTILIEESLRYIEMVPTCGAIYLHVIIHNVAAIEFYEKLGFIRVEEIKDYYSINGEHHNCYLYAKFLNGNNRFMYHRIVRFIWNHIPLPSMSIRKLLGRSRR